MEFIDRLGDLVEKPQLTAPTPASTNNRLVDRYLNFLEDSVQTIRKAVKTPDLVDTHVLTGYLDEIRSLEGELQGLKHKIFSLDDIRERMRKDSDNKGNLFDLRVAISHVTKQTKPGPTSLGIGMSMMGGVNLPHIEIPTFDGSILNWRPFWEQFQAIIHDKPHLEDIAKLTYCERGEKPPTRSLVKKAALCKNCLKLGHIASKCHTPLISEKCHKYHHALLHVEADPRTEGTKKVSEDVTYAPPSK